MIYSFAASLAFLIIATVIDIVYTRRGILAGGSEANQWIVGMFNSKPSTLQLITANSLFSFPMIACGVVGLALNQVSLVGISVGTMIAYAGKHIKGAIDWSKVK